MQWRDMARLTIEHAPSNHALTRHCVRSHSCFASQELCQSACERYFNPGAGSPPSQPLPPSPPPLSPPPPPLPPTPLAPCYEHAVYTYSESNPYGKDVWHVPAQDPLGEDAAFGTDNLGMLRGISEAACQAKLEGDYHLASTEPVAAIWGTDGSHSTCRFGRDLSATPVLGACRFFGPTFSINSTRRNPCTVDGKTFVREPVRMCATPPTPAPTTPDDLMANCVDVPWTWPTWANTVTGEYMQKGANGLFQLQSWSAGCYHAHNGSAGDLSTCLALCDYTSGCCSGYNSENHQTQATGTASHSYDSTCQSNSCGGGGWQVCPSNTPPPHTIRSQQTAFAYTVVLQARTSVNQHARDISVSPFRPRRRRIRPRRRRIGNYLAMTSSYRRESAIPHRRRPAASTWAPTPTARR